MYISFCNKSVMIGKTWYRKHVCYNPIDRCLRRLELELNHILYVIDLPDYITYEGTQVLNGKKIELLKPYHGKVNSREENVIHDIFLLRVRLRQSKFVELSELKSNPLMSINKETIVLTF